MNLGETSRHSCGSHDHGRAGRTARFGVLLLLLARPATASSYEDCAISGACCFPRSAPGPRPLPAVSVARITSIDVGDGPLGRPVVKRVLNERAAALGACSSEHAEVRASLVIAPSGRAQVVRLSGEPRLTSCVGETLRAVSFPVARGITEVELRIAW